MRRKEIKRQREILGKELKLCADLKHNDENDPVSDCHVGEHPLN